MTTPEPTATCVVCGEQAVIEQDMDMVHRHLHGHAFQMRAPEPRTTDYCAICGKSPQSATHMGFPGGHEWQPTPEPTEVEAAHGWTSAPESLIEFAWGIIANANHGDWKGERPEWREAAERWRDLYHQHLDERGKLAAPDASEEALWDTVLQWSSAVWPNGKGPNREALRSDIEALLAHREARLRDEREREPTAEEVERGAKAAWSESAGIPWPGVEPPESWVGPVRAALRAARGLT